MTNGSVSYLKSRNTFWAVKGFGETGGPANQIHFAETEVDESNSCFVGGLFDESTSISSSGSVSKQLMQLKVSNT